ncbi:hypothetical protein L6452_17780 [Arctium lappa]|uniref:Uncharacterized protein n=1 Tax=Arctium lappa TaxID=4217 RepID=A0ACB9C4J1_ARCLA|nr:hypothetical protein L6452_17780 [Arctium lappa]
MMEKVDMRQKRISCWRRSHLIGASTSTSMEVQSSWRNLRHYQTIMPCYLIEEKAKLSTEQKSAFYVKLKEVQHVLSLDTRSDGNNAESE